jgi:hypothetical protein
MNAAPTKEILPVAAISHETGERERPDGKSGRLGRFNDDAGCHHGVIEIISGRLVAETKANGGGGGSSHHGDFQLGPSAEGLVGEAENAAAIPKNIDFVRTAAAVADHPERDVIIQTGGGGDGLGK